MFCSACANNQINKIHKRTLRLIYEMEDSSFTGLLLKDNFQTVHENNIYTLLIEKYNSINNIIAPIVQDFCNLKFGHSLRNKLLLKLSKTITSKHGTQELCFERKFAVDMVAIEYKNINLEEFKRKIKIGKANTWTCK